MDYFNSLLQSYDKIKKRKFKITEGMELSVESEAKAKHYVQLAVSYAETENYIVAIPELGANARIFVAKNGKSAGKVVVDNVLSRYPIAVADNSGNPFKNSIWSQFVNKFGKVEVEDETSQQMQGQGMQLQPQIEQSETSMNLMEAGTIFTKLAQEGKFFTTPRSIASPIWMTPGMNNDYQELSKRVFGPDPFSVESKLNFGQTITLDPNTGIKIKVPLNEEDKKLVSNTFLEFATKINKIYRNKFVEEDAIWISKRIFNDKLGFWIKDPALLPEGISLSWRFSKSDGSNSFFKYLISNYNRRYAEWCKKNGLPYRYPIQDTYSNTSKVENFQELNNIRGKSAEELKIAINALSNKDYNTASLLIKKVAEEYGAELQEAYASIIPYVEGYAAADSSVLEYSQLVGELEKITGPVASHAEIVLKILPKLALFESESSLLRKPIGMDHVGAKSMLGFNADVIEHYQSPEDISDLLTNAYRFDPIEVQEFISGDTLNVGIKTYLKESDVKLSETSVQFLLTSLFDNANSPFINNNILLFGANNQKIKEQTQKLEKITQILNTVLADINIAGFDAESLKKTGMKAFFDKIKKTAPYDDLVNIEGIEKIDLDIPYNKEKVKSLLERKMLIAYLKKQANLKDKEVLTQEAIDWRRYISVLVYTLAGSMQNQLDEVRFFDTGRVYFLNHNKCLRDPLQDFINGNVDLDAKSQSSLAFYSPISKRRFFKFGISNHKKTRNYANVFFTKNYVKMSSKRAVIYKDVKESVESLIKNLQILLK